MMIRYGIVGMLMMASFLLGRWQSGNPLATPNVPDRLQTQAQKLPNLQGRVSQTSPFPESKSTADEPLNTHGMIEYPPLLTGATASVPRDTGPFIDATPGKITQKSDSSPPRDTGPFLDAGDPSANANLKNVH